ncbi:MAG: hypothetical protein IJA88_05915 [Clostridia bacterium]|nr:hypothetical protein [Clostridia bacterium]
MSIISVNNNKVLGRIKPVHSAEGFLSTSVRSEIRWNRNYLSHIDELGMPYARLNGVGGRYGSNVFVDVTNIFRDFNADEFVESSYDFAFTDWVVWECQLHGVKPIFRLGVSKEPDHWLKYYYIDPPKDYEKFARICEHIILHYNIGWNNGFKAGIKYWEIWDGPDNAKAVKDNACWKGTKEDYFEFYRVVSNHLSGCFSGKGWKFGGYGATGFDLEDKDNYSKEFFEDFIKYVTNEQTKSPFEFFTWNAISQCPETNSKVADYVRETLDNAGLSQCESICGSWKTNVVDPSNIKCASIIGANLVGWQNSSVSKAMFNNFGMGSKGGIFGPTIEGSSIPSYGYYVMQSFNKLYKLGFQVESSSDDKDVYVVAGADVSKVAILVVNYSEEEKEVTLSTVDVPKNTGTMTIIKEVDADNMTAEERRNLAIVRKMWIDGPIKFKMTPNEVRLIELA